MSDHELKKATEMVFACKICKKVFRKDMLTFEGKAYLMKRLMSTAPIVTITMWSMLSPRKTGEPP